MVDIRWFGHSSFEIKAEDGTTIVTDPFDKKDVGYENPNVEADIATVSHEHPDHNKVKNLKGNPDVIKGSGRKRSHEIEFYGMRTYHDDAMGAKRGENTVFTFEVDGLRICHLGDLGHLLDESQAEEIGKIDILFIPVGGFFTIDAKQADKVIERLKPRIIIPMHYKTPPLKYPIEPVENFIRDKSNVEKVGSTRFSLKKEDLPEEGKIVLLEYE
jgi:L-ascorbate metabolism protein UlaG (beta-lactamase superfamily)